MYNTNKNYCPHGRLSPQDCPHCMRNSTKNTINFTIKRKDILQNEIRQQERKNLKSRLEIILTDPDNYLRGQLEGLIKEL